MHDEPKKILVIANETAEGEALHEAIRARARGRSAVEVLVVAPALNSRLRHWVSDEDEARRRAGLRLGGCLARLGSAGIEANGWVGDADPLQAIADGLHAFAADEIVIATQPEGRSHWLARNLVHRARFRYAQPVHHVVVDLASGREYAVA
jgi:hypothetical protein